MNTFSLQIAQSLYLPYIKKIALFKDCSSEFINQIVIRLHEEYFLPGEVITEQGNVVDHLYFVCEGLLVCKILLCFFASFYMSHFVKNLGLLLGSSCYKNRWIRRECYVSWASRFFWRYLHHLQHLSTFHCSGLRPMSSFTPR